MNELIDNVAKYIPYVLLLLSIILLSKTKLVWIYIGGYILCILINKLLKYLIHYERPYWNKDSLYNMPSGHCMIVFYTITFMYLFSFNYMYVYYLLGLITVYNCIQGNYHTIDQCIVGIICGIAFGYIWYKYLNKMIS